MTQLDLIRIAVANLGWDYGRLSSSGQAQYNELCQLLGIDVPQNEVTYD